MPAWPDSMRRLPWIASARSSIEVIPSLDARNWGCPVVVVPDVPANLEGLDRTIEALTRWNIPFRIDPVIEPIGFGFAASLGWAYGIATR